MNRYTGPALFVPALMAVLSVLFGCRSNGVKMEYNSQKKTSGKFVVKEYSVKRGESIIFGRLYVPQSEGRHPAVILSHGYNGCSSDWNAECAYFASHGYVAYAYDFCGGSTRSRSSGVSWEMTLFTEKADLEAVLEDVRKLPDVDSERVFLLGGSQGGLVTSLVLEDCPSWVRAAVLYYPAFCIPDDWRSKYPEGASVPERVEFWGFTLGADYIRSATALDVFSTIGKYPGNILIIHGTVDPVVNISYSQKAEKLYAKAQLVALEGEGHGYSPSGAGIAMSQALKFMDEN